MEMTKIVASLMLSTALLPMISSKATTTKDSATSTTERVQPVASSTSEQMTTLKTNSTSAAASVGAVSATSTAPTSAESTSTSATSAVAADSVGATQAPVSAESVAPTVSAAPVTSTTASTAPAATETTSSVVASTAPAKDISSAAASTAPAKDDGSTAASTAPAKDASSTAASTTPAKDVSSTAVSTAPAKDASSAAASTAPAKDASSTAASTAPANATSTAPVKTPTSVAGTPAPKPASTIQNSVGKAVSSTQQLKPVMESAQTTNAVNYYMVRTTTGATRVVSEQEFLNAIKAGAIETWRKYRVLPSVTAAQAILESGWGKSQLAQSGHNLFGIKGSYNGQSVYFKTNEWNGSQYITVTAAFRKYPSWAASLEDHGAFLVENSRYANLLGLTDYRRVATLMQQDGYATSPTYASSLINLIQQYGLQAWDQEALSGQPSDYHVTAENGRYKFTKPTSIHVAADKNSAVVGTYESGQTVYYNAKVQVGGQTWLQYLAYSGGLHYVLINEVATPAPSKPAPAPTTPADGLPNSGTFKFSRETNIRNGASKSAGIVGTYGAGQTVRYNGKVQAGGLTWLRYVAYSGATHYVAVSGDFVAAAPKPQIQKVSGAYRFNRTTAIKTAANSGAQTVGTYGAGETVYYNAKVTVGNQTWLRYKAYSGATHYVLVSDVASTNNVAKPHVTATKGAYRFTKPTAIKAAADRNARTVGTYYTGNTVYYNAKVTVNGQTWLRYQSYSGATHYVEIDGGAPTATTTSPVTATRGSFRFSTTTNIRTAPSTHAARVGEYYPGDVVYYDGKVRAEGYTWLRYLSRSGAVHYVAAIR
ncbi:glucosaminidase domain-containing protein [Lactiplantibacillus plajomi]|nr:glucosaminidase domain-containing protein [Lactiplantibacillus plajomi]